jgi:hypothetical protein
MKRALLASLCVVLLILACGSAGSEKARDPKQAPAAKEASPAPPSSRPAATGPAVPQPEVLLVLIRTTLVALSQAVYTGNFTVLRDLGSPAFQAANSATQLGIVFADLRNRNIDLLPVVVVTPELSQPPQITADGRLRLVGLFPTHPLQIQFEIWFEPVQRQWRLSGLAVNTAAPPAAAASAQKGS